MNSDDDLDDADDEGDGGRLRATVAPDAVPVDLASAFAGDRAMTEAERGRIESLKEQRGAAFFSDLLYAISHRYFPPEIARSMWDEILSHKLRMSGRLGRNACMAVATLDYLSNITGEVRSFTLMSEPDVAELVNLSMRDRMTGLFNHTTCYELLELELGNHRRYGVGVALILLDIDDFKFVNDRWGHQEGDRILVELAATLKEQTRDSDICCRFGGEEFAVILRFTNDPREAFQIAERIRTGVTSIASHGQAMSVSAGVTLCAGAGETSRTLVERADHALYRAKRSGKHRVVAIDGVVRVPDST